MKTLLLLFVLVRCHSLVLASVEPVRNIKQGNDKHVIKRKQYKPVGASEKQHGYKDYNLMRSNEKDIAFPSHGNKWPRLKLTRNNEWKKNDNTKTSKEKGSKEWKRSNHDMWKNSKEASSFDEKIQGPSVVAQENFEKNSDRMTVVRANDNKIATMPSTLSPNSSQINPSPTLLYPDKLPKYIEQKDEKVKNKPTEKNKNKSKNKIDKNKNKNKKINNKKNTNNDKKNIKEKNAEKKKSNGIDKDITREKFMKKRVKQHNKQNRIRQAKEILMKPCLGG